MRAGLTMLCLAYLLSQFFRSFLAVLGSVLSRDLGTTPEDLATASALWFLSFAVMQFPVGWALDRVGPRLTASVLLLAGGGGGAALFAVATAPGHINIAMLLIGMGCAPVLMAAYYIVARQFSVSQFATIAALMLGVGSLGNLGASYPMALAVEWFGWRTTLSALAGLSAFAALGIAVFVRNPAQVEGGMAGSIMDLLRMRVLWPIFVLMFVAYAPPAAIRGLWIGPYLAEIYGLGTAQIGQASLVMGVAMIVGAVIYGPLDRIFHTQKWVLFVGNLIGAFATLALAVQVGRGVGLSVTLCATIGFFGATYPVILAHGRSFFPPQLAGRGVSLMNFFGIAGVGVMQFGSGPLHDAVAVRSGPQAAYVALFGFFGLIYLAGTLFYLRSRDWPH